MSGLDDSPLHPAIHLTAIRKTGKRTADTPPNDLVTSQSASGDADDTAQVQQWPHDHAISLPNMMGRGKMASGAEEQEALLAHVDGEETTFSNSGHKSSLHTYSEAFFQSTIAKSNLSSPNDRSDGDSEAARTIQPGIAPDQFLEGYETTKREIWAYYGYYIGNSGLTLTIFAPMAMQNLMSMAAGENGMLQFLGRERTVDSIALLASAVSFSLQIVVFLILGSFADFGSWRSSILIVQSVIGIIIGFAWLGIYEPGQWRLAVLMFIVGLVAFQTSLAYFFAAFPALARNTRELRKKAQELNAGIIELKEYEKADSIARNHIANTSLWIAGAGGMGVIAVMMCILYAVNATASPESNSWGLSLIIGFGSAVWLILAIPWFFLEKRRPGRPVPPGMNIFTAGLWQVYRAGAQIKKLSQSLIYLIGFFVLGESLNTSIGLIGILQNEVASYDITQLSQFIMMQFASATLGVWLCIKIQERYSLTTKTMLCGTVACMITMNLWGILGVWNDALGYHQIWEFWVFSFWFGCCVSPWYSYSQTMISEITPRGKDFLFFSLFNIIGKASSFIGPLISSTIIDADPHHNSSTPFYFLTALSIIGWIILVFFVDLNKSRREQERFLEDERLEVQRMADESIQKFS